MIMPERHPERFLRFPGSINQMDSARERLVPAVVHLKSNGSGVGRFELPSKQSDHTARHHDAAGSSDLHQEYSL